MFDSHFLKLYLKFLQFSSLNIYLSIYHFKFWNLKKNPLVFGNNFLSPITVYILYFNIYLV